MSSTFLNQIGLGEFDLGYLLIGMGAVILLLIRTLYKNMESAYQKMGLVKYDAFSQMGGQLSFSLALLDENNNGFIINSVHSSEGCYSYTKEIKLGQCAIDLGAEEAEALAMAMGE